MKNLKKISSSLILVALLFSGVKINAQTDAMATETFKVWGNCDMCKTTIEKSLKSVDGIKSAKWNVETKMITVKFETSKLTLERIKKTITASGYDTEEFKASNEVYEKLHKCCQYDRTSSN
ncbi:MAG: hypothetical protein A3K10_04655 [Bacteroidetes bacterium RIFCSPLOWO2_12_FULL_31_6]|nr:MAG: hypothetical protein A3K10_04655 [Bacteroidetes bacterium RIFCSPLOWO2_12_FULL_31_6]